MAQLTQDEKLTLAKKAHKAMNAAKNKKGWLEVWNHKDYGYLVLGHKVLGRLLVGKTPEEAIAGRGGK